MIAKLDKCVLSIYKGSQGFNIGRGRVTNKVTGGKRKQDVCKDNSSTNDSVEKLPMHYMKRIVRAGVSFSSVVEHWWLKLGGLGLIPSDGWLFVNMSLV